MIVEYRDGELAVDEPVKDFHGAALKGCDECADFLGRSADISVGSVGSMNGWTSVIIRTERGRLAFQAARSKLDVRGLDDPAALLRLDALDKKIADRSLQRKLDPDAPLFIDFEEHVRAYDGHGPPARLHPPLTVAARTRAARPDEPTVRAEGWLAAVLDGEDLDDVLTTGRRRRAPGSGPAGGPWPRPASSEDGPRADRAGLPARDLAVAGRRADLGAVLLGPHRSHQPAPRRRRRAPGCDARSGAPRRPSRCAASPSAARACRCWPGSTGASTPATAGSSSGRTARARRRCSRWPRPGCGRRPGRSRSSGPGSAPSTSGPCVPAWRWSAVR